MTKFFNRDALSYRTSISGKRVTTQHMFCFWYWIWRNIKPQYISASTGNFNHHVTIICRHSISHCVCLSSVIGRVLPRCFKTAVVKTWFSTARVSSFSFWGGRENVVRRVGSNGERLCRWQRESCIQQEWTFAIAEYIINLITVHEYVAAMRCLDSLDTKYF